MKSIYGVLPLESGRVTFRGESITGRKPSENVRRGMGYAPQGARVFRSLTVHENLLVGGFAMGDQPAVSERVAQALEMFPILRERGNKLAGMLSGGERQMLALGMLMVTQPQLILLDEPSGGLAPRIVDQVYAFIRDYADRNKTAVLLVEQDARHALAIANRVYVLASGRVVHEGPTASIAPAQLLGLMSGLTGEGFA
jgi:branched-chain amino acid transport system ATP-binding protein